MASTAESGDKASAAWSGRAPRSDSTLASVVWCIVGLRGPGYGSNQSPSRLCDWRRVPWKGPTALASIALAFVSGAGTGDLYVYQYGDRLAGMHIPWGTTRRDRRWLVAEQDARGVAIASCRKSPGRHAGTQRDQHPNTAFFYRDPTSVAGI